MGTNLIIGAGVIGGAGAAPPQFLDLNFALSSYRSGGTAYTTPAAWLAGTGSTFTGPAGYDKYGQTSFSANTMRVSNGLLLIEPSRTNDVLRSTAFTNASWATNGAITVTDNATAAPDGTSTAATFAGSSAFIGKYQFITVTNATRRTFSACLKSISAATQIYIGNDSSPGTATLTFDAVNGAITSTGAGIVSSGFVALSNGWYYVWGTYDTTGTSNNFLAYTSKASAQTFAIWNAQNELGAWPTSPIVTAGTAVTRAADALTIAIPPVTQNITDFYDDNSLQGVMGKSGTWSVPTTLNRPQIKRIVDQSVLARSGLFNFSPSYLSTWKTARDAAAAGTSDCLVDIFGDSTIAGTGYGSDKTNNVANRMALALVAAGFPARNEGFWSAHGSGTPAGVDSHLSVGAGWNVTTSLITHGGHTFRCDTASVSTSLSYTPYASADTVDIWYVASASSGSFEVCQNGGATIQTVNTQNASTAVIKTTVTVTAGTTRLDIRPVAASGIIDIISVQFRTAAVKTINVYNCGFGGATAATFASSGTAYFPRQTHRTLAPKLSIINLVINDATAGTATSTYSTNLQALITDAKLSGDVVIVIGPPSKSPEEGGSVGTSIANQKIYRDIARGLAVTNNCVGIDLNIRWGTWTDANAQSFMFDELHPNATGYADFGLALAFALTAI